ncbi:MAG TPA: manganese catalase family protein, partial [Chondromyces sp.]|nr:manganese catalase family protein [Chondromyces sp.]
HQNQWIAAIAELEAKENIVVPSTFPRHLEKREVSHVLFNYSQGDKSATGRWANGPSMDGEGFFQYVQCPPALGGKPKLKPAPPYIHDTPPGALRAGDAPPGAKHTDDVPPNLA